MERLRARLIVAALAVALLAAPAGASAAKKTSGYPDTPSGALRDCESGHYPLKGHYTIKVLQEAVKRLDAEGDQYTNCADVLNDTIQKLEGEARHRKGAGSQLGTVTRGDQSGSSGTPPIISEHLSKLKDHGGSPVLLPATGQTVTPGTVTIRGTSFLSSLPKPLLIVLAALLATVLAVSARAINNLVRTRRPH